jgi:2-hydroxymuconate-semialdehyde hydrolase
MVVAHSLPGTLAAGFASRHGSDLRRVVIYGAPGIGPYRMPLRLRYVAIRFAVRPTAQNNERFERFALLDRDATRGRDPEWFDAFSEYARTLATRPHTKRAMWQLIGAGTKRVSDEELRQIPVPVDLMWGAADRMVPIDVAENASRRLEWPLHVVSDAAHVPHMEQPDAFVDAIAALDPQPSGTHSLSGIRERITVS